MAEATGEEMKQDIISTRDRNLAAYLITLGFQGEFAPNKGGMIEIEFERSSELEAASRAYMANVNVPVQSFTAASRYVSDRINMTKLAVKK